jgi:hypothetical protein
MNVSPFVQFLCIAILFLILTPGVLITFPKGTNKYITTGVHAIFFTFVLYLFETRIMEGLTLYTDTGCSMPVPQGTGSPLLGGTNYYFNSSNPTGGSSGCESLTTPQGVNYNY